MDISFQGKRALVTGGSRGIGKGIAAGLVKCGAETIVFSKNQDNLDALVRELPSVKTVCVDLADWHATRAAVETVGPIDLLVNNAAVLLPHDTMEITPEEFDEMFAVNVKAVINVSQVIVKGMLERKSGGAIVNVSSIASRVSFPASSVYSATKAALDSFSRTMSMELAKHNIRVNTVNPTVVWTDMGAWAHDETRAGPYIRRTSAGRFAEVEDITPSVLFLLSEHANMVHGAHLNIDGGLWAA